MAGNTVILKFIGDTRDISGAFRTVGDGMDRTKERMSKFAAAAGAAFVGVAAAVTKLSQSHEKELINLRRAVENTGTSFKSFGKDLAGAEKQQAKYGNNAIDTARALTTFTQKLHDPKKALQALALASDLAAAKNISLDEATGLVTKAYSGNAKVLAQFGINIKDSKAAIADATKAQGAHQTAVEKLADAQQRLSDLEAIQAAKKTLTISDEFRLRDAKLAVVEAQDAVTTTAEANVTAQAKSKDAIKGTEAAVSNLRGQVKGLADEQAKTLEGRLKTLQAQMENVAIELGDKFGPAIAGVGTVSTIAANAVSLGLSTALLGSVAAFTAAAGAGVLLGIGLNQLIETHFPGVNRALEDVGGKLVDFAAGGSVAKEKMGGLAEATRIFNLTGEATPEKIRRQIAALQELAIHADGPTKVAIQNLVNKLLEVRSKVVTVDVDTGGANAKLDAFLRKLNSGAISPRDFEVPGGRLPTRRAHGGPVTAGSPYIVGEHRPELFVPNASGTIIPRVPTGGTTVIVNMPPGSDGDDVVNAIKRYERRNGTAWRN